MDIIILIILATFIIIKYNSILGQESDDSMPIKIKITKDQIIKTEKSNHHMTTLEEKIQEDIDSLPKIKDQLTSQNIETLANIYRYNPAFSIVDFLDIVPKVIESVYNSKDKDFIISMFSESFIEENKMFLSQMQDLQITISSVQKMEIKELTTDKIKSSISILFDFYVIDSNNYESAVKEIWTFEKHNNESLKWLISDISDCGQDSTMQ